MAGVAEVIERAEDREGPRHAPVHGTSGQAVGVRGYSVARAMSAATFSAKSLVSGATLT